MAKQKLDLVQIIRDNPGCVAVIFDNDYWTLYKVSPSAAPEDDDDYEKFEETNRLASADDDFTNLGDGGYGYDDCYGGDIFQALAQIVGVKIESG